MSQTLSIYYLFMKAEHTPERGLELIRDACADLMPPWKSDPCEIHPYDPDSGTPGDKQGHIKCTHCWRSYWLNQLVHILCVAEEHLPA